MRFHLVVIIGFALDAVPIWAEPAEAEAPLKKLNLKPAQPPAPVLRHPLLPNLRDQTEGNAAVNYNFAVGLMGGLNKEKQQQEAKINEQLSAPAKEINIPALKEFVNSHLSVYQALEAGARQKSCDWYFDKRLDEQGFNALLPELQDMRRLAQTLRARCRLHQLQGETLAALDDVRTGFALARHVGEQPTLIASLVGVSIFMITSEELENVMQMPDCPNLYWSLTALPRPFIRFRRPLEGEARGFRASFPMLVNIERPMTPEQARDAIFQWQAVADRAGVEFFTPPIAWQRSPYLLAAAVVAGEPAARRSLIQMGRDRTVVDAMPAAQVVLLDATIATENMFEELSVWFDPPFAEARQGVEAANLKYKQLFSQAFANPFRAAELSFLPAISRIFYVSVRCDRRAALLRTVELLRLYAFQHGRLPQHLSPIDTVVVPLDPTTGQPFPYELMDNRKALLSVPPVAGQTPVRNNAWRYEITLSK